MQKGIYWIEASYAEHGIVKAGLIYDEARNGNELVDDNEFILQPENGKILFRVKIHDDSAIRFKLRLTGDAVEGDYILLQQVYIVSSSLTYVYPIIYLLMILLILDLGIWCYVKYYKTWNSEQKMVSLMLIMIAFIIELPLWQKGITEGADLRFHLQRIEGVYKGLLSGQFPVRIQPGWMDGYGYASSVFYGDIFMYFPALLRMAGFTVEEAYKWYMALVSTVTVIIAFYSFRKITKDNVAAMMGTVLYACSTEKLNLQYAAWVGNHSAMMFYPLVLAGFYLIFTEDEESPEYKKLWVLLTIGFTGLLMTHMQSCILVGSYAVLGCLFMVKKLFRKKVICELLKAAGVAILINLWYLVPFMQYMFCEKLCINSALAQEEGVIDYYVKLADFTDDGQSLFSLFVIPEGIDYVIPAVLILYIVTMPLQKKNTITKYSRGIFLYAVSAFWLCTNLFPVIAIAKISKIFVKYFTTLQYQNRFIGIAVTFMACLAALFFVMDIWKPEMKYILTGLLCCIALYQDFRYFTTITTDAIYLTDMDLDSRIGKTRYDYGVGNGEFLPVDADTQQFTKEIGADEAIRIEAVHNEYLTYDVTLSNLAKEEQSILLPAFYYGGFTAYDSQSKERLEIKSGNNGRIMVTVPAGYSGTFHMEFCEPWYWRAAEIVSVAALIGMIYYMASAARGKTFKLRLPKETVD
ncbi:MAG: hypothetical protein NC231_09535 [Bacillus sp. (in: Bacteria)]|nr:hypothetical protein [Bacillus sp. (in: firmicutes)]MCM1425398.1 hypothetical protein [Eubacterium sp.]